MVNIKQDELYLETLSHWQFLPDMPVVVFVAAVVVVIAVTSSVVVSVSVVVPG